MKCISSVLKVFCSILYLKCFKRKITKLSNFYYIVEEMKMTRYIKNTRLLVAIMVTFDFSVPVYFLIFQIMNIYCLAFFLLFQLCYLVEMLTKKERESKKNCDCFIMNLPRKISFSSVFANVLTSYVFVMIFLLDNI